MKELIWKLFKTLYILCLTNTAVWTADDKQAPGPQPTYSLPQASEVGNLSTVNQDKYEWLMKVI